jgi:hypothetical protein
VHRCNLAPLPLRSRSGRFQMCGPYGKKADRVVGPHNFGLGQACLVHTKTKLGNRSIYVNSGLPAPVPREGGRL